MNIQINFDLTDSQIYLLKYLDSFVELDSPFINTKIEDDVNHLVNLGVLMYYGQYDEKYQVGEHFEQVINYIKNNETRK